jgi:hypothetical protein
LLAYHAITDVAVAAAAAAVTHRTGCVPCCSWRPWGSCRSADTARQATEPHVSADKVFSRHADLGSAQLQTAAASATYYMPEGQHAGNIHDTRLLYHQCKQPCLQAPCLPKAKISSVVTASQRVEPFHSGSRTWSTAGHMSAEYEQCSGLRLCACRMDRCAQQCGLKSAGLLLRCCTRQEPQETAAAGL